MNYSDWMDELSREEKAHRDYRDKARKVQKVYELGTDVKFNILWSNVETLEGAVYSNTPKPDIRRRFKESHEASKSAAEVLERAIVYSLDQYDFDGAIKLAVNCNLVPGLGQVRVNYTPYFTTEEEREDLDVIEDEEGNRSYFSGEEEVEGEEDEQGPFRMVPRERKAFEEVSCSVVPWSRFRWSPAKDWETVWWVGEEHFLTEEQVKETFVIRDGETIPLGYSMNADEAPDKTERDGKLAKVCEVWDKRHRMHFGIIEGMSRVLKFRAGDSEAEDDPLNLKGFWPYPEPMAANVHAGKWVPMPDYLYYQDQALELNELTVRISALTKELKYRGAYDGTFEDLANIVNGDDGSFKAIPNFAERFAGKGLDSVIAAMPLEDLKKTIEWLLQAREQVKQTIYEITGISDIFRGATKASETLGAQQLKGQFANMRISPRQKAVQRFCRDIIRIKAEIIAEHYDTATLEMMTGLRVTPDVEIVLRSDVLRNFSIDIETDSTILSDMGEEQQNRIQVVEAMTQLGASWAPMVAQNPGLAEVVKEMSLFLLGAFRTGKQLESVFERLGDNTTPGVDQMAGAGAGLPTAPPGDNVSPLQRG